MEKFSAFVNVLLYVCFPHWVWKVKFWDGKLLEVLWPLLPWFLRMIFSWMPCGLKKNSCSRCLEIKKLRVNRIGLHPFVIYGKSLGNPKTRDQTAKKTSAWTRVAKNHMPLGVSHPKIQRPGFFGKISSAHFPEQLTHVAPALISYYNFKACLYHFWKSKILDYFYK